MNAAAGDPQVDPAHRHEAGEFLGQLLGYEDVIVTHDAIGPVVCPLLARPGMIEMKKACDRIVHWYERPEIYVFQLSNGP
jgi:hypothetical protein